MLCCSIIERRVTTCCQEVFLSTMMETCLADAMSLAIDCNACVSSPRIIDPSSRMVRVMRAVSGVLVVSELSSEMGTLPEEAIPERSRKKMIRRKAMSLGCPRFLRFRITLYLQSQV